MSVFNWESAWDRHDGDHFAAGTPYYDLPDDTRIYEGDRFWSARDRCILEVTSVRTKIYTGEVGGAGERGGDCVFYDADGASTTVGPTYLSAEAFAELITDDDLVPHSANGIEPPP